MYTNSLTGNLPYDIDHGYTESGTIHPIDPEVTFSIATMFIEKIHEAKLPEELQTKFINLFLVNLDLNILPEDLTFTIAVMILEYLTMTQLSTDLMEKASKILVAVSVQKCSMLNTGNSFTSAKSSSFHDGPRIMTSEQIYRATVAEVDTATPGRAGWDSEDEEDDIYQDEEEDEDVSQCGILSNTVFNMTD